MSIWDIYSRTLESARVSGESENRIYGAVQETILGVATPYLDSSGAGILPLEARSKGKRVMMLLEVWSIP